MLRSLLTEKHCQMLMCFELFGHFLSEYLIIFNKICYALFECDLRRRLHGLKELIERNITVDYQKTILDHLKQIISHHAHIEIMA